MVTGAEADLDARLSELSRKYGDKVPITELVEVVRDIINSLRGGITEADLSIYNEIDSLVDYIHNARREIIALCPEEISAKHIPAATDELDAIVFATEEATATILDCAEKIEKISVQLKNAPGKKIVKDVTRIYEACNFQDVTGQRIGKVVKTLRYIEDKVEALAAAFGEDVKAASEKLRKEKANDGKDKKELADKDLSQGPQLAGKGVTQEDIDTLLDSLD